MRRSLQAAVVAALLAVNAAIILQGVHEHRNASRPLPAPPTRADASPVGPSPGATDGSSVGPLDRAAAKVKAGTSYPALLLSATSTTDAWRAAAGCGTAPALASVDSRTGVWNHILSPDSYLLRIQMTGTNKGWVIGANATCSIPAYYRTTNGGASWTRPTPPGHLWYETPVGVVTPAGTLSKPCAPASPAPLALGIATSRTAGVICSRGVFYTTDGGSTWKPTGPVTTGRAIDIALTKSGAGVLVMADHAHCQGTVVLVTSDAGASWEAGQCLKVANPPLGVSLAQDGSGLLSAAQAQYTTTDYGHTWN